MTAPTNVADQALTAEHLKRVAAVWLSATVLADYADRGAFPGLRLDKPHNRAGTWALFSVPIDFAHEVLADAEQRKHELRSGRGLFQAYRSLAEKLARELDRVEGVTEAPDRLVWDAEMKAFNCHPVGTQLLDDDGEVVTIASAYSARSVQTEAGEFRSPKSGRRVSYRYGYTAKRGEQEFFYAAGDLYDRDGAVTHLRLVHSA